jgi:hypothetical protein
MSEPHFSISEIDHLHHVFFRYDDDGPAESLKGCLDRKVKEATSEFVCETWVMILRGTEWMMENKGADQSLADQIETE